MIGQARVPADYGSQSGYALATGKATIVDDWSDRDPLPAVRAPGALRACRSAAIILIKGKGSRTACWAPARASSTGSPRRTSSFMQAIANVLANAIERRRSRGADPARGAPRPPHRACRTATSSSIASSTPSRPPHRRETPVAVLFLDLDQFKLVNDSLGHAAGDELLAAVAPRIEQALRPGDTVARFGGDEFAILAEDIGNERGATRIAERVAEALARPVRPARAGALRQREHRDRDRRRHRAPRGPHPRRRLRPLPRQGSRPRRLRDLRRGHALARDRAHADRERPAAGAPARGAGAPLPARRPAAATARSSRWRRCCAGTTPSAA